MKSHSTIMVYTLVVFSLVSPGLAEANDESSARAESQKLARQGDQGKSGSLPSDVAPRQKDCSNLSNRRRSLRTELSKLAPSGVQVAENSPNRQRIVELQTEIEEINDDINRCEEDRKEKKQRCDTLKKDFDDQASKTKPSAIRQANECFNILEDNEFDGTAVVMNTMMIGMGGGQSESGSKRCKIGGAKTDAKEDVKKAEEEIKSLEKSIRESDKKALERQKDSAEELRKISEARQKLKEDFEEAQEEAKRAEAKSLADHRDNQMRLADNIRKLQAAAIEMRQKVSNTEAELRASISNAKVPGDDKSFINLKSERAIQMHCRAKGKAAIGGTSASKSATQGRSRVETFRDTVSSCIENLQEYRQNIMKSYVDALEQRAQAQKDVQEQLQQAQQQVSQQTEQYNKLIQQLSERLLKAQQNYFQKDQELENQYNQALQRAQQEQFTTAQEKLRDQSEMMASYKTRGDYDKAVLDEIRDGAEKIKRIIKEAGGACAGMPKNLESWLDGSESSSGSKSGSSSSGGGTR